jgi:hypothetical protein
VATHHSTPVGAIIGGVVGGVVGVAILALAVFFVAVKRRRKGRAYFYAEVQPADILGDGMRPLAIGALQVANTTTRRSEAVGHGHEPYHALPNWHSHWLLDDGLVSSSPNIQHHKARVRLRRVLLPNTGHARARPHRL